METQYDPVEDAAGEPARVSSRFLWFIGLMLALLLAGGGYVVTEHIMTSKAIEQLGRSVAHGVPPAMAPRSPAVVRPAPGPALPGAQPAPSGTLPATVGTQSGAQPGTQAGARPSAQNGVQPGGDWIGGDADLAAETSGSSRGAAGRERPDGALRVSGGAEPLDDQASAESQAAFDTAGSSSSGGTSGAGRGSGAGGARNAGVARGTGVAGTADGADGARTPAVREEGSRARRARVPGYEAELERHYSTIFARCPRPGVPGAVECRRAVCAGGARKTAACRYYADGRD